MDEIVYIPVEKLHPHPDNPRKELGDLSELTESIKISGVLQNLTVVPWFDEKTWLPMNDPDAQERMGYRVIIGHRRLAASKLAGLTELPCIIKTMYHDEQIRTMLVENMQRSDLTVYEQAEGFQMMMNLGDSIEDIARKSGFSQTTVRRRVKLLELDKDQFKKSVERGATLTDYMELDKIKSPDLKNEVLEAVGTKNFRQKLQAAIDKEKAEAFMVEARAFVSEFATRIENVDYSEYTYTGNIGAWSKKMNRPDDADTVHYYYKESPYQIDLFKKKADIEAAPPTEKELKASARREEASRIEGLLNDASKRAKSLRRDYIAGYTRAKSNIATIDRQISLNALDKKEVDHHLLSVLLQCNYDDSKREIPEIDFLAEYEERPEFVRLCTAYASMETDRHGWMLTSYGREWVSDFCGLGFGSWVYVYKPDENLKKLYSFLILLGYEISDEEDALLNGTSELFEKLPENEVQDD